MGDIFADYGVLSYLAIFIAKIIEVVIATLRIMYVSKGEKVKALITSLAEVAIWIVVVNSVLSGIQEDPMRAVAYCLAFALGNYLGISLEEKMAAGLTSIQVIVQEGTGEELKENLRDNGFGVTSVKGEGKNTRTEILMVHLVRKRSKEALKIIKSTNENAVIIVNELKNFSGGYLKP